MLAVRVMEVTGDQVVDVAGMGDGLMATAGAVAVGIVMSVAMMLRGAADGMLAVGLECVLVDVIAVRMV